MQEVLFVSNISALIWMIIGMIVIFIMLRIRDKLIGVKEDDFRNMLESPVAAAIYFGLTAVGACILVGLAIS